MLCKDAGSILARTAVQHVVDSKRRRRAALEEQRAHELAAAAAVASAAASAAAAVKPTKLADAAANAGSEVESKTDDVNASAKTDGAEAVGAAAAAPPSQLQKQLGLSSAATAAMPGIGAAANTAASDDQALFVDRDWYGHPCASVRSPLSRGG